MSRATFKELEDGLEIRDKKRQHQGQTPNSAETLNYLADFCEEAIPRLKPDDVAEIIELPTKFADFMKV